MVFRLSGSTCARKLFFTWISNKGNTIKRVFEAIQLRMAFFVALARRLKTCYTVYSFRVMLDGSIVSFLSAAVMDAEAFAGMNICMTPKLKRGTVSPIKNGRAFHMKKLEDYVRSIPDFPEPGIIFRDVTSVLQDADGLHMAIDQMQACLDDVDVDVIIGTESRGFIFGMPIAYNLHKPFVLVRKKGKLPCETISRTYDLEYGTATIEMHKDSIKPGQKVAIIDDLIATGGTVEAAAKMVEDLGGQVVKIVFLMELAGLKGREKLKDYDVSSVICYDGK